MLGANDILYGFRDAGSVDSYGTVYQITTSGAGFNMTSFGDQLHDLSNPFATLVEGPDGRLRGTIDYSYNSGPGAVYSIGLGGSDYSIDDISDGAIDSPVTFDTSGNLFCDTYYQNGTTGGALFEVPIGGDYENVFSFDQASGFPFLAPLFLATDGDLYSTTISAGQTGAGTIFRYDPTIGQGDCALYIFWPDGAAPWGGVIQASDGQFYGTTYGGPSGNYGTIFKFSPSTLTVTTLHKFIRSDGAYPFSGVTEAASGELCGTTSSGGAYNAGVIYRINKDGSNYKLLYSFEGRVPIAGVAQFSNGRLYGTTQYGGTHGGGAVYSILTNGGGYTVLHTFSDSGTDGINPKSLPTEGSDGNIYGVTYGGSISPYPGTNIAGKIWEIAAKLPIIDSISPASGVVGARVTITGANFGTVTEVDFNGVPATILSSTPTQAVVTVPANATTCPVTVKGAGYTTTSKTNFTVTPPTITKFTPGRGPVGTTVTITGTAFVGVTNVTFHGASAPYTVNSPTSITATVPSGATTGKIVVTTQSGMGVSRVGFVVGG